MIIRDIETSETGGVECIVDDVLYCPVRITGAVTTYPHDDPDFDVDDAELILNDKGFEVVLPTLSEIIAELYEHGFYTAIFKQMKEAGE